MKIKHYVSSILIGSFVATMLVVIAVLLKDKLPISEETCSFIAALSGYTTYKSIIGHYKEKARNQQQSQDS